MTGIYDVFSKEFDTTRQGFSIDHKLGGNVFSEDPINNEALFVDRIPQGVQFGRALAKLLNGSVKKIIVIGEKGIGKSSLVAYLLSEKEKQDNEFYVFEIPSVEYAGKKFKEHFTVTIILKIRLKETIETRDDKRGEEFQKLLELLDKDSLKETVEKAKELGYCSKGDDTNEFIKKLIVRSKNPVILAIDDYQILNKYSENRDFVWSILELKNVLPVIVMPTNEYYKIINEQPNFNKNAEIVEIPPLETEHLIEMFAKRILRYNKQKTTKEIDYSIDILPFQKGALNLLALLSEGNPLKFIRACNEAYTLMSTKQEKQISEEFIKKEFHNVSGNKKEVLNLPKSQNEIYTIILNNPTGLTTNQIIEKQSEGTTPSNVIQILNKLIEKNTVRKERRNRFVYYFPSIRI